MSAGPTVRAVVVNWNGAHLLGPCMDSLLTQDLPDGSLEIVVVDNASTDSSVEYLARQYPTVQVRSTASNLGFAGGVNIGLEDLQAPYVVLLNNDATFEPSAVRHLVEHLGAPGNERVGAATALILLTEPDASGNILVNSTGNVLTSTGSATDRDWLTRLCDLDAQAEVFGFCGGAAALRREALSDVGLFDGTLFLYYEDTDLSWRLRASGWGIHYVQEAVAHHQHAASSDAASSLFRYYNTRNSLLVLTRHAPLGPALHSALRQAAAWARYAITRSEAPELVDARRRALSDSVRSLPRSLRQRRATWSGRAALRREIYRSARMHGGT